LLAVSLNKEAYEMSAVTTTIYRYLAMWNETDTADPGGHRHRALDGDEYIDPVVSAETRGGLIEQLAGLRAQYPGHRLRRANGVRPAHGDVAWELVGPYGTVAVAGIDVGALAPDGRLKHIVGFFEPLPWEAETAGSFATGQARHISGRWRKSQMVAAGL
jgi:hypothetical protein